MTENPDRPDFKNKEEGVKLALIPEYLYDPTNITDPMIIGLLSNYSRIYQKQHPLTITEQATLIHCYFEFLTPLSNPYLHYRNSPIRRRAYSPLAATPYSTTTNPRTGKPAMKTSTSSVNNPKAHSNVLFANLREPHSHLKFRFKQKYQFSETSWYSYYLKLKPHTHYSLIPKEPFIPDKKTKSHYYDNYVLKPNSSMAQERGKLCFNDNPSAYDLAFWFTMAYRILTDTDDDKLRIIFARRKELFYPDLTTTPIIAQVTCLYSMFTETLLSLPKQLRNQVLNKYFDPTKTLPISDPIRFYYDPESYSPLLLSPTLFCYCQELQTLDQPDEPPNQQIPIRGIQMFPFCSGVGDITLAIPDDNTVFKPITANELSSTLLGHYSVSIPV